MGINGYKKGTQGSCPLAPVTRILTTGTGIGASLGIIRTF